MYVLTSLVVTHVNYKLEKDNFKAFTASYSFNWSQGKSINNGEKLRTITV